MALIRTGWWLFKLFVLSALLAGFVCAALGAAGGVLLIQDLADSLPPLTGISHKPSITTKIYDVNGVVLDELFADELRERIVTLSQIPKITQAAFIATEDQRFYSHYGIDPKRIIGALVADMRAGGAVQGASTITQQLAKNVFLKPEKTIERKLKEVIMAIRLERTYTKDEILALYLNEIFFGHRIFGIASAAKYYFGKDVKDLSLGESSLLAGLPKSPNRFSPFNRADPRAWKDRQKVVLGLMLEQGYITAKEYQTAAAEELRFAGGDTHSSARQAPYFVEYVKSQLLDRFGFKRVFSRGLKVYTTLDMRAQQVAEKHYLGGAAFKNKPVEDFPTLHGAFLAMDPNDGSIRAMVGGRDFKQNKFNRAVQARRQPGSSFKPFVYAAAFAAGLSPTKIAQDVPYSKWDPGSQTWWSPQNYGKKYSGPITLARALATSKNVVSVRLCESIGVEKVIAMAQRLGVMSPLTPNLTLALGSSEVTLLEMVSAYGSFANGGIHVAPRAISRVEDASGQVIHEEELVEREVLDEKVAYTMATVMQGALSPGGTAYNARIPGYQFAGKTGTNQDFRDAWFVGYMADVVVGCNIGYDEPKSLGKGQTGGRLAAPIVSAFLKDYIKIYNVRREFRPPSGMVSVKICGESGDVAAEGCTQVNTATFAKEKVPTALCKGHTAEEEGEYEAGPPDDETMSTAPADPATDPGEVTGGGY